jgi:hypothetical protein
MLDISLSMSLFQFRRHNIVFLSSLETSALQTFDRKNFIEILDSLVLFSIEFFFSVKGGHAAPISISEIEMTSRFDHVYIIHLKQYFTKIEPNYKNDCLRACLTGPLFLCPV